ncbi:DUF6715 family protein [Velocimicrobium porci]|uniref:Uncharacterized protein n=1 Tax=Velocimicrobium porci TaxID=2606634 RepID=A0A6L5XY49_9FIRM|nr:DUF6715 family protein [Velocimicrobium porci]MSS63796.1 hypothetical protein [Velocimicrobium porci]
MKKSTKKILTTILIMITIGVAIVAVYYNMTKEPSESEKSKTTETELEKILNKDLEANYPGTPREVMKFYGRITSCLYKGGLSDEDIEKLADKLRGLMDDELLEKNPESQYIKSVKKDVKEFRDIKKIIMSYSVQNASEIEYSESNGEEYATCTILFLTQEKQKKKSYHKVYEKFILRQDENENWKILGWEQTDPVELPED